jgi:hypothetical protein
MRAPTARAFPNDSVERSKAFLEAHPVLKPDSVGDIVLVLDECIDFGIVDILGSVGYRIEHIGGTLPQQLFHFVCLRVTYNVTYDPSRC